MALLRHVLLIDDSAALCEMLEEQFRAYPEFALTTAASAKAARAQWRARRWDVVLLDLRLPDGHGLNLCRDLRAAGAELPIIMLTALGHESDSRAGFAAGATDYIVKPFRFALLLARLRAHLHQHVRQSHALYHIGSFLFAPAQKNLRRGRKTIPLTGKEADMLQYFCQHPGGVIPRAALLAQVWGYKSEISTHTLETHIYRLRQKLERNPKQPRFLQTTKGGYCFHPDGRAEKR